MRAQSVADELGLAMIDLYVEFQAYEIAIEAKNAVKDTKSFGGRISRYIEQGTEAVNTEEAEKKDIKDKKLKRISNVEGIQH